MYYNTNKESGNTLIGSHAKTQRQEDAIFEIFLANKKLSASQAWNIYPKKGTPITSIRRAITNLCNDGKLIKTDSTINGMYGKKEHIYQLSQIKSDNQTSLF